MDSQNQLDKAIALIQAGDENKGGLLLIDYLRQFPRSEQGWLWMTNIVADIDTRLECLDKALAINPKNQHALAMQAKLQQYQTIQQSEPTTKFENDRFNGIDDALDCLEKETSSVKMGDDINLTSVLIDYEPTDNRPTNNVKSQAFPDKVDIETADTSQNLKLGFIGGLLGMLLGAGIWGITTLLTGLPLAYIVLIVGVITGFAVRLMGQGSHLRFGFIGGGLTIIGCILGAYVYLVPTYGTLGPNVILPQIGSLFNPFTAILWVVTSLIGFWLSFYRPRLNIPLIPSASINK